MNSRPFLFVSLFLLVFAVACNGQVRNGGNDDTGPTGPGANSFEITDIDGNDFSLDDHLGKDIIVLSFWSTWCEPCKAEMPTLQKMHDTFGDKGLKILSVSLDGPETMSGVKPYVRSSGYTFTVAIDEDTSVAQSYNPRSTLPFMVILNRDGSVHKKIEGFHLSEAESLVSEIKALVEAK
jgi:peroxiredoxin